MSNWRQRMRQPLKNEIARVKELLQATDKDMARHLRLKLADFEAISSGAVVLPIPAQKSLKKRMEALLERCGINTEQRKQP